MTTNRSYGEIIEPLDADFVDAIFDTKNLFTYGPLVLFARNQRLIKYLLEKFSDNGIDIRNCFYNPTCSENL